LVRRWENRTANLMLAGHWPGGFDPVRLHHFNGWTAGKSNRQLKIKCQKVWFFGMYLVRIGNQVLFFDIVNRFLAFDGSGRFDLSEVPKISIADRPPYQRFIDGDSGSVFPWELS